MKNRLLYNLYKKNNHRWRYFLRKLVIRVENGEMYSDTLRKIFLDYHNIEIGMYSYGCFYLDRVPPGTIIGRYCSFARDFFITFGNHPINFKSTHPFFYNPDLGVVKKLLITRTLIKIENDVWIGKAAIILPGVKKISNGAVIGAGSVVVDDVPPYAIVAGNPAKIIRYRFPDEKIKILLEEKWWEQSMEEINASHFCTTECL